MLSAPHVGDRQCLGKLAWKLPQSIAKTGISTAHWNFCISWTATTMLYVRREQTSCWYFGTCKSHLLLETWGGEKNDLFRPSKKFELTSASRKCYRSLCELDKGSSDLPEIRQSLYNNSRTAKSGNVKELYEFLEWLNKIAVQNDQV